MVNEPKKFKCETCFFRKFYERKPKSILGRLWKWHTGWCPGWRAYQTHSKEASTDTQQ